MRIGYASLALGVYHSDFRTVRLANLSKEKLEEIIDYNLTSLDNLIEYNYKNDIKLFRITSDVIPFGSKPDLMVDWKTIYKDRFKKIGEKIKKYDIKVSMHPGQYTVINSKDSKIVNQSVEELVYHAHILNLLETPISSKMVLHIGGVYGDKQSAIQRFIYNFKLMPNIVKERLVIENDEKSYNIEDVLYISSQINIPVIFDNLHHDINPPTRMMDHSYWVEMSNQTWKKEDGVQKIHYSEQSAYGKKGAHSFTINPTKLLDYLSLIKVKDFDVMLEVKDKNLSATKIIKILNKKTMIKDIENEWSKYKYAVLSYSPQNYIKIKNLLKNKKESHKFEFYNLIDSSLKEETSLGNEINALCHVWGYFKNSALDDNYFIDKLDKINRGNLSIDTVKKQLYELAYAENNQYLLDSYYFHI